MRAGASRASTTAPTVFLSGLVGMYWLPTPVISIVVRSARSTRITSAGRSRATPKTSNPLPRLALVAGARTVIMRLGYRSCPKKIANRADGSVVGGRSSVLFLLAPCRSAVGSDVHQRSDDEKREAQKQVETRHQRRRRENEDHAEENRVEPDHLL